MLVTERAEAPEVLAGVHIFRLQAAEPEDDLILDLLAIIDEQQEAAAETQTATLLREAIQRVPFIALQA